MKTSEKIKIWARVGQIAFWFYLFGSVAFERQLPMHEATVFSETTEETILAIVTFIFALLVSEAIVKVIGYFAELLDKS